MGPDLVRKLGRSPPTNIQRESPDNWSDMGEGRVQGGGKKGTKFYRAVPRKKYLGGDGGG